MPPLQSRHYAIMCYCACADLLRGIADHASFCQQCNYKLWSLTWQWVASRTLVPWRIHGREYFRHHFSRILLPQSDSFHRGRLGGVVAGAFVGTRSAYITHFLECTNVIKYWHNGNVPPRPHTILGKSLMRNYYSTNSGLIIIKSVHHPHWQAKCLQIFNISWNFTLATHRQNFRLVQVCRSCFKHFHEVTKVKMPYVFFFVFFSSEPTH